MKTSRPEQIRPTHLARGAVVYLRQSTAKQVEVHTGSTAFQRHQKDYALQWGWPEDAIEMIDQDLGLSGTSGEHRSGWQRLLKLVSEGRVGVIFVSDISRLSRSRRDFFTLVDLCREFEVLLVVEGVVVQFDDPHDTFMANIRADVAEYDNQIRKNALMKGRLAKARQGHAVSRPPHRLCDDREGPMGKGSGREGAAGPRRGLSTVRAVGDLRQGAGVFCRAWADPPDPNWPRRAALGTAHPRPALQHSPEPSLCRVLYLQPAPRCPKCL